MTNKVCTKCLIEKPITDFHKHKNGRDGLNPVCKLCVKERQKVLRDTDEYRKKNAARQQRFRIENPETYKAYVDKNRERIRQHSRKSNAKWRKDHPERYLWYRTKATAKAKGLPFNITPEDIVIPTHCPVLGIPISVGLKGCSPNLANVDKIIPAKGYVKGNIRVISFRANRIKCDATLEEIRAIERYLAEAIASQSNPDPEEPNSA